MYSHTQKGLFLIILCTGRIVLQFVHVHVQDQCYIHVNVHVYTVYCTVKLNKFVC